MRFQTHNWLGLCWSSPKGGGGSLYFGGALLLKSAQILLPFIGYFHIPKQKSTKVGKRYSDALTRVFPGFQRRCSEIQEQPCLSTAHSQKWPISAHVDGKRSVSTHGSCHHTNLNRSSRQSSLHGTDEAGLSGSCWNARTPSSASFYLEPCSVPGAQQVLKER